MGAPLRTVVPWTILVGFLIAYALFSPRAQTIELVGRLGPIMLFLATISIVINLAAAAGLFHRVAEFAATGRAASGPGLWVVVVLLAVVSTTFLSLDTTAVLVTPLVLALARRAGHDPIPLALTVVWIANTGSLLLPVSNLTNLLAVENGLFDGTGHYIRLAALPATASLVVTLGFSWVVFRRRLQPSPQGQPGLRKTGPPKSAAHPLLHLSGCVVAVLLPLLTTSIPFWWSTSAAAIILVTAFALTDRSVLHPKLVPWTAMAVAVGLTVAVQVVHSLGLEGLVRTGFAQLETAEGLLFALAAAGAVLSNLINNIPAYLLLEPAADSSLALTALLIGSNFGPIVTPWASLATLLWADQLRRAGLGVPWRQFILLGIPLAVGTVGVSVTALAFVPGLDR
ncbi:ArsB/NhaD family transporter [Dietzia maris]|uniref:SLC13 family permease n=1 Tax=Dietzia maris TaxID=37915 RepID=UPI0022B42BC2|nr:SLC13 family permease [Dietzia maris]MCZ4541568.1 ArsB/NhaD family transporter [Dietzia maris]